LSISKYILTTQNLLQTLVHILQCPSLKVTNARHEPELTLRKHKST